MSYGRKITPKPITAGLSVQDLVDGYFTAYNAARLREACRVMVEKIFQPDVTVVLTITGALTPTGMGYALVTPLIEAGLVDWIISTGANLYHDIHFSLGYSLYSASPNLDDLKLREEKIIRIYDILFDQEVLLESDAFLRRVMVAPEFQRRMGTARCTICSANTFARRRISLAARTAQSSARPIRMACRFTPPRRAILHSA